MGIFSESTSLLDQGRSAKLRDNPRDAERGDGDEGTKQLGLGFRLSTNFAHLKKVLRTPLDFAS
jgi:hypothetical protein